MNGIEPGWLWLIGGVLLLIAEIIAPGFFLVFIGAAAMATGLFTIMFGLGAAGQLALFALYALLAVMVGRRIYANRTPDSAGWPRPSPATSPEPRRSIPPACLSRPEPASRSSEATTRPRSRSSPTPTELY
jgi:hypothetical protein